MVSSSLQKLLMLLSLHVFWGITLYFLVFLIGLCTYFAFNKSIHQHFRYSAITFPLGILVLGLFAFVTLLKTPFYWFALPPLLIILFGLKNLIQQKLFKNYVYHLFLPLLSIFPFGYFSALFLGLCWRGPSMDYKGSPMGDLFSYVIQMRGLQISFGPFPLTDLVMEGIPFHQGYANVLPSLMGILYDRLHLIDPYLYFSTTLPTFLFCTLALIAHEMKKESFSFFTKIVLALIMLAGTYSFSWMVESPPVILTILLCFSVLTFSSQTAGQGFRIKQTIFGFIPILLTYFTKVMSFPPFAVFFSLSVLRSLIKQKKHTLLFVFVFFHLLVVCYLLWLLKKYINYFPIRSMDQLFPIVDWIFSFKQNSAGKDFYTLRLFSLIIAVGVAWKLKDHSLFVVLCITTYLWLIQVSSPATLYTVSMYLIAGKIISMTPLQIQKEGIKSLLFIAGMMGAFCAFTQEHILSYPGKAGFLLACSLFLAFFQSLGLPYKRSYLKHFGISIMILISLLVPLTYGRGFLWEIEDNRIAGSSFGPEEFEIWDVVRKTIPDTCLIFTDWTAPHNGTNLSEGGKDSLMGAWQQYSGTSGRQVYFGGWNNTDLRFMPDEANRRFKINQSIIDGLTPPDTIVLSRKYSGYFAVLSVSKKVPSHFFLQFKNLKYALYKITGGFAARACTGSAGDKVQCKSDTIK